MRKSFTRAVAFLLSVVLCLGLFPISAFAAENTSWPKLTGLTLKSGATLESDGNADDRDILKVDFSNYIDLEDVGTSGEYTLKSVGKVTISVASALSSSFDYVVSPGTWTPEFTTVPSDLKDTTKNLSDYIDLYSSKNFKASVEIATDTSNKIKYCYEVEVTVAPKPPLEYPVLTSLTVNANAKLIGEDNSEIPIIGVTFENYDVARNPETNKKVAGEVKI